MALFRRRQTRLLQFNNDTFRVVLERRAAYATASDKEHVEFSRYMKTGVVDAVDLSREFIGELAVPTGEIVAADPFYIPKEFTHPFAQRIPSGSYPVFVSLADLGVWGERVAYAWLQIRLNRPIRWELATTTATEGALAELYGIDAGLGCFADTAAAGVFSAQVKRFYSEHPEGNFYDDVLSPYLPADRSWCDYGLDPESGLNVVIFSSGFGDGIYSSYWGLDAKARLACLLTDFQVFDLQGTIARG